MTNPMKNKQLCSLSRRIQWMGLVALVAVGSACDSGPPGELPELDGAEDLEDLQEIEGIAVHEWIEPQTEDDPWFDPDAEIGEFSAGVVLGRTVVEGGEGPMVVTYENVHGHAIVEGDIDLGPVESLPEIGEEELDENDKTVDGR